MTSQVKSYQIIPNNKIEQEGGDYQFTATRLMRIIKIFLTLFINNSFDNDLNLLKQDGTPNKEAKLAELLELTQTKHDRITGLDDFVNQLIKAKVDLNLILNSNIKDRLRANRESSDNDPPDPAGPQDPPSSPGPPTLSPHLTPRSQSPENFDDNSNIDDGDIDQNDNSSEHDEGQPTWDETDSNKSLNDEEGSKSDQNIPLIINDREDIEEARGTKRKISNEKYNKKRLKDCEEWNQLSNSSEHSELSSDDETDLNWRDNITQRKILKPQRQIKSIIRKESKNFKNLYKTRYRLRKRNGK